jgi:hypothetical protein
MNIFIGHILEETEELSFRSQVTNMVGPKLKFHKQEFSDYTIQVLNEEELYFVHRFGEYFSWEFYNLNG